MAINDADPVAHANSFLLQLRQKRDAEQQQLDVNANAIVKKYLTVPIYNNIKLLNEDVDTFMTLIKDHAVNGIITTDIGMSTNSILKGFRELKNIYDTIEKKRKWLVKAFWIYVNDAFEMFVAAFVQKTGIPRQPFLPANVVSYYPHAGIYAQLEKGNGYKITVWW